MTDAHKKLIREFPATAEGKAFHVFMLEEMEKLKDVTTVTAGEVELRARQDAIKYIKDVLAHFKDGGVAQPKPRYD